MEPHDVTDTDGNLDNHMHTVHHFDRGDISLVTAEEVELFHADDHDDLRRGIGA